MNHPDNLLYTATHEWVQKLPGGKLRIGLTDYAQNALGDIVFVNLPVEGDPLSIGASFADVESVKAVSEVFSPADGTVSAINEMLLNNPELLNEDPYGSWLIEIDGSGQTEELLDVERYKALLTQEH